MWVAFSILGAIAWVGMAVADFGGHFAWWDKPTWSWWFIPSVFLFMAVNSAVTAANEALKR